MDKSISHEFLGQLKTLLDYVSKNYFSFIEMQLGKVDELFELARALILNDQIQAEAKQKKKWNNCLWILKTYQN